MKSSSRNYSDRTLKILWGRAAGRCAVPSCRVDLLCDEADYDPVVVIGDIAHMAASSDDGPRADAAVAAKERDVYENLILLCKNCHARIDGQPLSNPISYLRKTKADHEAWVRASLPERGKSVHGWTPLIVQGDHPIDAAEALKALAPDSACAGPELLTLPYSSDWKHALSAIRSKVAALLEGGDPFNKRFAIFALAPVSACIATGYAFTNRPKVRVFQHHRATSSWAWSRDGGAADSQFAVEGVPKVPDASVHEVAICFHLSAVIAPDDLPANFLSGRGVVHVRIPAPSVQWLKNEDQVNGFGQVVSELFGTLAHAFPDAARWHLFYAGPAPGAVRLGQQLNPTMSPPTQLYEFNRTRSPRYTPTILLTRELT